MCTLCALCGETLPPESWSYWMLLQRSRCAILSKWKWALIVSIRDAQTHNVWYRCSICTHRGNQIPGLLELSVGKEMCPLTIALTLPLDGRWLVDSNHLHSILLVKQRSDYFSDNMLQHFLLFIKVSLIVLFVHMCSCFSFLIDRCVDRCV